MTVSTVEDLAIEQEIAAIEGNAQFHGWLFERIGPRTFRVCLSAHNGDEYQIEVDCSEFPTRPAEFHWRNRETGELDRVSDSPQPFGGGGNYFFPTGRICAPWNRLASTDGGPHPEWSQSGWKQQPETRGTVTLAAMVLRVHHELKNENYLGRQK